MSSTANLTTPVATGSTDPWLDVRAAAAQAGCATKTIYYAIRSRQMRAAKLGGRRVWRVRASWVDAWLESTTTPIEVER